MKRATGLIITALLLASCAAAAAPVREFVKGDELAYYDFETASSFEVGTYGGGAARLEIRGGVYRIVVLEGDSEVWYGQWGDTYDDVLIEAQARQITQSENTVYGVMCRMRGQVGQFARVEAAAQTAPEAELTPEAETTPEAELTPEAETTAEAAAEATVEPTAPPVEPTLPPSSELNVNNGDGYLFLIEGAGRGAILLARGRSVEPLLDWTSSSAINKGAATNRIRAVCMGDYLALYVNDTFVGDAIDDTYMRGQVGMAGAAASRLGLTVEFDNLRVSRAQQGGQVSGG